MTQMIFSRYMDTYAKQTGGGFKSKMDTYAKHTLRVILGGWLEIFNRNDTQLWQQRDTLMTTTPCRQSLKEAEPYRMVVLRF
jgi:hypothetical protein